MADAIGRCLGRGIIARSKRRLVVCNRSHYVAVDRGSFCIRAAKPEALKNYYPSWPTKTSAIVPLGKSFGPVSPQRLINELSDACRLVHIAVARACLDLAPMRNLIMRVIIVLVIAAM
ncbi:hypothetical protein [Bradyrhizobium sp. 25ACV]